MENKKILFALALAFLGFFFLPLQVLAASVLPGKVEFEDYGPSGYLDTTPTNLGGVYRNDSVDIQSTSDVGGGYHLGWVVATEYVSYPVTVATAGTYNLEVRVSNTSAGGGFRVLAGNVDVTGLVSVPNTGSWDVFSTVVTPITLAAGSYDLKFTFDQNASNGWVGDFNYFSVVVPGVTPTPVPTPSPSPTPANIDTNNDYKINILDLRSLLATFLGAFNIFDISRLIASYGNVIPTPTIAPSPAPAPSGVEWPMIGADPTRSSHNSVVIAKAPVLDWYNVIDPYIDQKVQVIAANNTLFVSTSRGLIAFDPESGAKKWDYGTEMPLGNAPTYDSGVLYVGGYDHRVHAVSAVNGSRIWLSDEAGAGFETNPVVANGMVYMGNRDGYFYAFGSADGKLKWRYKTSGPIRFSAAYKNNVLYFASDDSYAYAVNATTGAGIWKSAKLPGVGFSTYWPVIYTYGSQDYILISGSKKAAWGMFHDLPGKVSYNHETALDVTTSMFNSSQGCLLKSGNVFDCSAISNYFATYPKERHFFVLNALTGVEKTDIYAPINWAGVTRGGNKYPPIIGGDGQIYTYTGYVKGSPTTGVSGWVVGWKFGTSDIVRVYDHKSGAGDEPVAVTAGGNLIHWGEGLNADAWGSVDVTKSIGANQQYLSWDPRSIMHDKCTHDPADSNILNGKFWDNNSSYTFIDGAPNLAPIPYNGRLYIIYCNTLISLIASPPVGHTVRYLTTGTPAIATYSNIVSLTRDEVGKILADEVNKIISAGHLRSGFMDSGIGSGGLGDGYKGVTTPGNYLHQYFTTPYDTLWTLSSVLLSPAALAYLPAATQTSLRTYLQSEQSKYPIQSITNIGWMEGAKREAYDDTDEMIAAFNAPENGNAEVATSPRDYFRWYNSLRIITPNTSSVLLPEAFYGAWKYAQVFPSSAATLFDAMRPKLPVPGQNNDMTDDKLIKYPYLLNEYIVGYKGYIELAKLAGRTVETSVQTKYNELVALRLDNYKMAVPFGVEFDYNNILNTSRNFIYMTPELGGVLAANQTMSSLIVNEYNNKYAPYWFVSKYDRTYGEGVFSPLYDHVSHFLARAYILNQPYSTLVKYLDVPAFERGDLFYIQMLVALLNAP